MPADLTVKLRSYFRNTLHLVRAKRYEHLLLGMSTRLRGDASFNMAKRQLSAIIYLRDPRLEPEFLSHLAVRFSIAVYSRLEHVPCLNLFIIDRGVVAKNGALGLARASFGKDVIIASETLRDIADAIALTFVQTIMLTRTDIMSLLPDFPVASSIIRKHAFRISLIRALCKAAALYSKGEISADSTAIDAVQHVLNTPALVSKLTMKDPAPVTQETDKYFIPSQYLAKALFRPTTSSSPVRSRPSSPTYGMSGGASFAAANSALVRGSPAIGKSAAAIVGGANASSLAATAGDATVKELKEAMGMLTHELRDMAHRMDGKIDALTSRVDQLAAPPRHLQKRKNGASSTSMQGRQHSRHVQSQDNAGSAATANGSHGSQQTATEERSELRAESALTGPSLSTPFELDA